MSIVIKLDIETGDLEISGSKKQLAEALEYLNKSNEFGKNQYSNPFKIIKTPVFGTQLVTGRIDFMRDVENLKRYITFLKTTATPAFKNELTGLETQLLAREIKIKKWIILNARESFQTDLPKVDSAIVEMSKETATPSTGPKHPIIILYDNLLKDFQASQPKVPELGHSVSGVIEVLRRAVLK
jgi:hypothetical protein